MRVPAWITLGAAILLLGFELSMLAIGLFGARVSPAYRDFFIERRTDPMGRGDGRRSLGSGLGPDQPVMLSAR